MTNLLIITTSKGAYAPRRFKEEAMKTDIDTQLSSYRSFSWDITCKEIRCLITGEELPKATHVILREPGFEGTYTPQRDYLLHYYHSKGIKVLNAESFLQWSILDKFTQMIELQKVGLPFVESKNYCSKKQIKEAVVEFPVIIKNHSGSHGDKVYKINSHDELVTFLDRKDVKPSTLLIQPFLPRGEDIRVIVIGGKVIGAIKRIAVDSHLTNYSAGGRVERYELENDTNAIRIAEDTVRAFKCEYAGVDLMRDKQGDWKILEINRSCQFEGFEKGTNLNVAKHTLNYLLSI
jgi:gamma-F420-2:alpha-L-glutamate ligase